MKPVTERDVARLIGGEIDDPLEARRILDAIDSDPTLGELADFLSGDLEDEESEPEPLPFQLPNLTKTQLCRMHTPIRDLTSGSTGKSSVDYGLDGRLATFDLSWRIDGEAIRFEAPWPSGLRPIGLVLAQFKLVRDTVPFPFKVTLPPLPRPVIEAASIEKRKPVRTGRGETPVPRSAAAQSGATRSAGNDGPKPSYWADYRQGELTIRGPLREGRDEETVLAEVFADKDNTEPLIRVPVNLTREKYSKLGSAVVKEFPWPTDRPGDTVPLKIAPLDEAGVPLLCGPQVSGLLRDEKDAFVAISIHKEVDGTGNRAELRLPIQRAMAAEEETIWWLRMTEEGGAA